MESGHYILGKTLDILVALSFSSNLICQKLIQKAYKQLEGIEGIDNGFSCQSPWLEKSSHPNELYARMFLGIVHCGIMKNQMAVRWVESLYKKGFRNCYTYIKNKQMVDLEKLENTVAETGSERFQPVSNQACILVTYFFCKFREITLINSKAFEEKLLCMNLEQQRLSVRLSKEDRELVAHGRKKIPASYFALNEVLERPEWPSSLSVLDILSQQENLSLKSIVGSFQVTKKDIDEIILLCMEKLGDVDYYFCLLYIKILLRSYSKLKKEYMALFGRTDERGIVMQQKRIIEELRFANAKQQTEYSENLQKIKKESYSNLLSQEREIKRLHRELEAADSNKKELLALREYVFAMDQPKTESEYEKADAINLQEEGICIVGGSPAWQQNLKKRYPKWKYLDSGLLNFDINIFNNIQIIYINIFRLNHPFYYKVAQAAKHKNVELKFIRNANIDLVLHQIQEDLQTVG